MLMNEHWIQKELGTLYGQRVVKEIERINTLYEVYDGPGQNWHPAGGLSYRPNKTITNFIKKLIKAEARFFASRAPEIRFAARDKADEERCGALTSYLNSVLDASGWRGKLIRAGAGLLYRKARGAEADRRAGQAAARGLPARAGICV